MRPSAQKIFLSCKKASAMEDKKELVGISIVEELQLRMHRWICNACDVYHKQTELLSKAISKKNSIDYDIKISKEDLINHIKQKVNE